VSTGTAEIVILRCFHRGLCGFPLLTGDAPIVVVNAVGVRVGESPGGHAVTAGRIKKIIPDRGFGFVRADDGNEVFFHRTELTTVDFDALQEGEQVTFDIVDSPKGPRARNLQKV
jgi:CspA family cold shock protein